MSSKVTALLRRLITPVSLWAFSPAHEALIVAAVGEAVSYAWSWLEKEVKGHK